MDIFRRRLAARRDYFQLFLVTLFPIHVWSIVIFFKRMPELTLRMTLPDIMGVAAYVQTFALLESLLAFAVLFVISLLLPARFVSGRLVPMGTVLILLTTIAAVLVHLYGVLKIDGIEFGPWVASWSMGAVVLSGWSARWIDRNETVCRTVTSVAERLAVLSMLYLVVDVCGAFLIVFRNL